MKSIKICQINSLGQEGSLGAVAIVPYIARRACSERPQIKNCVDYTLFDLDMTDCKLLCHLPSIIDTVDVYCSVKSTCIRMASSGVRVSAARIVHAVFHRRLPLSGDLSILILILKSTTTMSLSLDWRRVSLIGFSLC